MGLKPMPFGGRVAGKQAPPDKNKEGPATIIQDPSQLDIKRIYMESQDSKRPESVGRIHKSDHQEQCEFEY